MGDQTKIVYRASKAAQRAPEINGKTKLPGYGGFIPGAPTVIERNFYQTTDRCFNQQEQQSQADTLFRAQGARREFRATGGIRAKTSGIPEPPKYLPGYQGFVPQVRFTYEMSEGNLAKSWAPRVPINGMPAGDKESMNYTPMKERFKPRQDKYTIGYTGHLQKADAQIEKSFARIARGCENKEYDEPQHGGATVPGMAAYKPYNMHKEAMPDYKLPGYTGFVPQNNFTFEKRFSQTVLEAGEHARYLAQNH